ncbi:MAG: hypothetical protein WBA13_08420 [Microcoleaceae cyanobacterium]
MTIFPNFKLQIEIPAISRIADALEGINYQMKAQNIVLENIEQRLIEMSQEIEDLNKEKDDSTLNNKPDIPYYY